MYICMYACMHVCVYLRLSNNPEDDEKEREKEREGGGKIGTYVVFSYFKRLKMMFTLSCGCRLC